MSNILEDIKLLREKYVFGSRSQSQEIDETIFKVCDALEASSEEIKTLQASVTVLTVMNLESIKIKAELTKKLEASLKENVRISGWLDKYIERWKTVTIKKDRQVFELQMEIGVLSESLGSAKSKLEDALKENALLKRDDSMAAMAELEAMCTKLAGENVSLKERPNITHERLRQMKAKAKRRWQKIRELEDQLDVQSAANARLEMRAVALQDSVNSYQTKNKELNTRLEKCVAVLKKVDHSYHCRAVNIGDNCDCEEKEASALLLEITAKRFMNDNKQLFENLARQEKLEEALEKTKAQYGEALANLAKQEDAELKAKLVQQAEARKTWREEAAAELEDIPEDDIEAASCAKHDWVQGGMGNHPVCRQCGEENE